MINPCGDSLDMVLPYSVGNSTSKSTSSNAKNCNGNGWTHRKMPSEEELIDGRGNEKLSKWCWGRIGLKSTLLLFVLFNFAFDWCCAYLSMEHLFASYIFATSALFSFITICAVLNGIQREQKTMIKISAMYAGIKAVVLLALTLTALAGLIEEHLTNAQFQPSVKVNLLFCLLPMFAATLFIQYQISQRIVRLFRLRDQFYVISAANLPIASHEFGWKGNRQSMDVGKI